MSFSGSNFRDLITQIQSLPETTPYGKLLVKLAQKLVKSSQLETKSALLNEIVFSVRISTSDRHAIIQSAISQYSSSKKSHSALGEWLTSCAKEHTDDFKSCAASIIDTLESKQITSLETLTQMTLKDDEKMLDIEYTNGHNLTADAVDLWASLPEELSAPSFFTYQPEHELILDHFLDAAKAQDTATLDKLLSLPLLTKSPVSSPSLFARIWTTVSCPVRVRVDCLIRFTRLVGTELSYDFQGFIPHLIVGLSDASKEIRSAAAHAISALERGSSSSASRTVVGLTDLYVEDGTSGLKWLSPATAVWLVNEILTPKLEECRLDFNYVVQLLAETLNQVAKKGKKEQYDPNFRLMIETRRP